MSTSSVDARSKMCRLTVELPESVVRLLGPTTREASRHLVELAVIELFRRGDLSGGKAAELLGLTRAAWLDLLARHDIPHTVVTEESLDHDLEALATWETRRQKKSSPTPGR
jgi:predicted HTH domain antitoxin